MLHHWTTVYCFCIVSGVIRLGTAGHFQNSTLCKCCCIVHPTPNMLGFSFFFYSKQLTAEQTAVKSVHKHLLFQWFHIGPTPFSFQSTCMNKSTS